MFIIANHLRRALELETVLKNEQEEFRKYRGWKDESLSNTFFLHIEQRNEIISDLCDYIKKRYGLSITPPRIHKLSAYEYYVQFVELYDKLSEEQLEASS